MSSRLRTGVRLWSDTHERKRDDIFSVQDDIARSVADALQIKLGLGDIGHAPGMTRDVAAYDEYLRGMARNLSKLSWLLSIRLCRARSTPSLSTAGGRDSACDRGSAGTARDDRVDRHQRSELCQHREMAQPAGARRTAVRATPRRLVPPPGNGRCHRTAPRHRVVRSRNQATRLRCSRQRLITDEIDRNGEPRATQS